MPTSRRALLRAAALGTVALAGCSGDDGDTATPTGTAPATETDTPTDTRTATETPTATAADTPTGTTTDTPAGTASETPTPTETPTTTSTATGGPLTLELRQTAFDPLRASVEPGTTVTWVNRDPSPHDVVSTQFHDSASQWDYSAELDSQGATAAYAFSEAGIYEYYCSIHGQGRMCGVVLVGDVSLEQSLPCE